MEREAVKKYCLIMEEKTCDAERRDLSGGGMLPSFGGASSVRQAFRAGEKVFSDQRVLGGSDFVEAVLRAAGEAMVRVFSRLNSSGSKDL